jgi:hypothetical protein
MLMMLLAGAWLGLVWLGGAEASSSASGYGLAGFVFLVGLGLTVFGFVSRARA